MLIQLNMLLLIGLLKEMLGDLVAQITVFIFLLKSLIFFFDFWFFKKIKLNIDASKSFPVGGKLFDDCQGSPATTKQTAGSTPSPSTTAVSNGSCNDKLQCVDNVCECEVGSRGCKVKYYFQFYKFASFLKKFKYLLVR